jgi:hypothetical protein
MTEVEKLVELLAVATVANGGEVISDTSAHTGKKFKRIVINEDAVFTTLTDENGVNMIIDQGLTGVTIKGGLIIGTSGRGSNNAKIVSVTLSSGSIQGVL